MTSQGQSFKGHGRNRLSEDCALISTDYVLYVGTDLKQ